MSGRRGNLVALTLTRAVIAASGVIVNVALARGLSRDDFGTYRWIWATVAVAAFGAHLGLWQLLTRRVSRDASAAQALLPIALRATFGLSTLTGLAIVGYVAVADGRSEVMIAAALGALTLMAQAMSQLVQATFHGLRRMFLELPGVLAGRVVFVVSQLGLLVAGYGLVPLYGGRALAALVMLAMLLAWFRWKVGRMAPVPPDGVRDWVAEGPAFASTVFFGAVAAQADLLMLQGFADTQEVARYAAPASILLQLAFVANIVSRGFYPKVAALADDDTALPETVALQLRMLLWVSVPVAVGGAVVGDELVVAVFGPRYADAVEPFLWLLLAVPVRFMNNGLGFTLTARDRQGARARIDMLGAGVNVLANVVAIPFWGAAGAAATTLLTDVVVYAALRRALREGLPSLSIGPSAASAVLAAAVMGVGVWMLPGSVWVRVALGVVVYAVASRVTGAWRPADLRQMLRV